MALHHDESGCPIAPMNFNKLSKVINTVPVLSLKIMSKHGIVS